MNGKKDIAVSVLDSETHQGDYISIEIKSSKRYIKSCYIKLILIAVLVLMMIIISLVLKNKKFNYVKS